MFGFKSRRRLLLENAAMRQSLLWYAAGDTWCRKAIHQRGAPRKKWRKSPAAFDRGSLANRVLACVDDPRSTSFSVEGPKRFDITVPSPLASSGSITQE